MTADALPTASPESHGLDSRVLLRALSALEESGLDPHGFALVRDGVLLARGAWAPWSQDVPGQVYSVSKTFTSLAIGHLVAEGRLTLDDDVGEHVRCPNPAGITVRHLLTMTTGHTPAQLAQLGPPYATADLLGRQPAFGPGSFFAYSSAASFVLSDLVTALTGQCLSDYLRPRVFSRLGIGDRPWLPQGDVDQGYAGLHLTIDDLARLGVALATPSAGSDDRAVPPAWRDALATSWVDNAHHDPASPDFAAGYGLQVWRSRHGFRADGAYGQFCLAVPERRLAIAYLGATPDAQAALRIWWDVVESVGDAPLPENPAAASDLQARLAALDSWRLPAAVDPAPPPLDPARRPWRVERTGNGWRLTLGEVAVDVGHGAWRHAVLEAELPPTHRRPGASGTGRLRLAARGAEVEDGVEIHLVVPTSPHRLVVRARGSETDVAWHTVPLWWPTLSALTVPALEPERTRSVR